ncbi:MAG: hypothetical protein P4L81_06695 [Candidatus Pacebacteria bacterium]|nr:hypothetical protein [Candidatus Paceibacterota bacterium]
MTLNLQACERENLGYKAPGLNDFQMRISAHFKPDEAADPRERHKVNEALGSWILSLARSKGGGFDEALHDALVEQGTLVLADNYERKTSPMNVCIELQQTFESTMALYTI